MAQNSKIQGLTNLPNSRKMKTIFKIGVWHMIRKLTVSDNEEVMALLKPEATQNLFIIGDIENFGYESDVQDLWLIRFSRQITCFVTSIRYVFLTLFKRR